MEKLKVGIVGFGYMGRMHAMCYESLKFYYNAVPDVCLYAVADSNLPDNLPVKFEKTYANWQELVTDEDVDIVDICAPNFLHKEILIAAIKAKKHIYCEKPLALDLESAREVMQVVHETGYNNTSRISFEYRFVPAILRAKTMLDEGVLGKLVQFNCKYYGSEFVDPNRPISWQSTKEKAGGGVLYAMGTHALDLIRNMVGEVDRVFALKSTHFKTRPVAGSNEMGNVELEDIINVQLDCNGVPGTLLLSQVAAGAGIDFTFEVYGEKGTLKFDQNKPNYISYFSNTDAKEPMGGYSGFKDIETTQKYGGNAVFPPPRVNISWSRYHIASIYDFIMASAYGRQTHPDLLDGYRVNELADAIYASADKEQIIQVKRETF
ncbi:MAG: Gfo/Idh/MocA family oxidoreductase [Acidaminococcaceae bacterium]